MAATRKSAKRTTRKKRSGARRASAKKRPVRKPGSKRGSKKNSTRSRRRTNLKGKAQKGLRVARQGMDTVRQAGERSWEVLKSTAGQVVEGVRGKLSQNPDRDVPD
jgi:hypothetical protein